MAAANDAHQHQAWLIGEKRTSRQLIAGEGRDELGSIGTFLQRQRRQVQPDNPALGAASPAQRSDPLRGPGPSPP
jgi:hypothetical protein